ncbi:F0F1 ATP synthase subunit B [Halotalea alkalilenta]|uniref:ATP synthase subunit b n=1 Tax=Halotalea alkalilenta TaxID=376489 RepID=A0A172YAZ8_9GAMM|nr:F0F1 ATP synthase subunit B [Halotalea alkalilenta]ANF56409.1 F0F1 ATP synthase subunit B [Halotalea alkalilenta]
MNINLTLIGQAISFAIFVWFCMKYVWPPISSALAEREKKIAEGLNAADRAKQELDRAQAEAEQILRETRDEAAKIVEQARSRSNKMIEEARETARVEGQRMIDSARAEIEQEVQSAKLALRAQVASLAVQGAERILESSVDEKKHADLLDKLAAEL